MVWVLVEAYKNLMKASSLFKETDETLKKLISVEYKIWMKSNSLVLTDLFSFKYNSNTKSLMISIYYKKIFIILKLNENPRKEKF